MIYLDDHYFDFDRMEAYRGVDYQNFNIRRKECLVYIAYVDGAVCRWSQERWEPWRKPSALGFVRECHVTEAYKRWLDDEIDSIVF